jgi:putative ABC transport system permease protein
MFRNYFKTAFNNLVRNKLFSSINIVGLALGITASLLIMMYIVNELSYERFQKNRKNIYRIAVEWGNEGSKMKFAGCMPALAPAINSQIPEVESAVRIKKDYDAVIKDRNNLEFKEENLFFVDPGVFGVFSFNIQKGNKDNALTDPYSVVISTRMALKYFGSTEPLGQVLTYHDAPLKITGIIEDVPENTHFRCDFLVSYSTLKAMGNSVDQPWNSWGDDLTYILLKNNVPVSSIVPKLDQLLSKNAGVWLSSRMKFDIQPLNNIHWETDTRGDIGPKGNKTYVYIFMCAAIFVLMIACFNFLNLSISQYMGRMKEVGIRKTAGAGKGQVVLQFMTQSFVVILISALISVFLFDSLYLKLYAYLGTTFVLAKNYLFILSLLVVTIIVTVGAIAGGYPALFISSFNPIEVLKKETSGIKKKLTLRRVLIMVQFSISIILIVGTIIIYLQLDYMKNSDLGFNKENVVLINFPGSMQSVNNKYDVLKEELLKNSNISFVSGAYTLPGINSQMNIGVRPESASADFSTNIQALPADFGFVKSMGLEIIEGRDLSKDYSKDRYESVLLNQTAVSILGLKNPVGEKLIIPGEEFKNGVTVVGIVRDFHLQSFQNKINPMLIYINPKMYIYIALRINPMNIDETLKYIKSTWDTVMPGTGLKYKYLADTYNNMYNSEEKTGQLLSVFTSLALFISCLGLFGFVSSVVKKRIKEVGIRKVMGAKVSGISSLLSLQFIVWIAVSSVIACPVAHLLVKNWLRSFSFRIEIHWWVFAIAISLDLLVSLLIVGWLSWRAATSNPVEALRYE